MPFYLTILNLTKKNINQGQTGAYFFSLFHAKEQQNFSNLLKYFDKRLYMLFCNKLLNVLFCTRFTWLKRHTVCKTLAVCIGNTSLFQRPAEIFSDREQPRKNFSRAAIPGCRITAPDFLLQKNTLLFQKWQTGSRHWAERDTSSPDCPMPEGNPFHFIFFTGAGAADHAVRIGLLPAFLQIQDVPLFNPGTLRSPVLPAPAMCRYPGALSPVYPVLSHFFCHFRMLQSRAQTAKLPGSAGHQFPDFPAAFRGRPLRLHQPGGAQPLFVPAAAPCNDSTAPGHPPDCG